MGDVEEQMCKNIHFTLDVSNIKYTLSYFYFKIKYRQKNAFSNKCCVNILYQSMTFYETHFMLYYCMKHFTFMAPWFFMDNDIIYYIVYRM